MIKLTTKEDHASRDVFALNPKTNEWEYIGNMDDIEFINVPNYVFLAHLREIPDIYEILELHSELWTWLSDNPQCSKEDWPGWSTVDKAISSHDKTCLCCAYDVLMGNAMEEIKSCAWCPLRIEHAYGDSCLYGLYDDYTMNQRSLNYKETGYVAAQIANLEYGHRDNEICLSEMDFAKRAAFFDHVRLSALAEISEQCPEDELHYVTSRFKI